MSTRALAGAALLALAACGGAPTGPDEVAADSLLADALVTLHLADARAAATGAPAGGLRAAAYAAIRADTGLDSAAVARRLDAALARPAEAAALYRLVTDRLQALQVEEVPDSLDTDPASPSPAAAFGGR